LVSAIVAGTSRLIVVALATGRDARDEGISTLLALERLEQLSGALDSGALTSSSPANALDEDVAGWSERVDAAGRVVGAGAPDGPVFVRRWRVMPVSSAPALWRIDVRVLAPRVAEQPTAGARRPGEALL